MNTPSPTPTSPVPTGAAMPSIGSVLGTIAGLAVNKALKLDPLDPTAGGAILGLATTGLTALFHWIGVKLNLPGL